MKKVLSVFLVIILAFVTGCGGGGETAEQAVKNALDAIKAADVEKASKYVDYEKILNSDEEAADTESDAQSEEMAKMVLKNLQYKILESSEEKDTATVKVEITNLDMGNVMAGFVSQLFPLAFSGLSEEQMETKSMEIFTDLVSTETKTVTKAVDISLSKKEDGWKIETSDEFADAILGGMITYSENMNNSFGGSDKLSEINNWLIGDIWNDGLCEIGHYTYDGTGSTGNSIDIDFTLSQLGGAMDKKAEYDNYINGLDDEQYSQVKSIWEKLSPEIDNLYSQIKANKPVASDASTDVDTGKFEQYQDAFSDAVYALD
ncbi:MAG: DUF4878 domain-containing protein [Eubacteriales bacterium]|nr:DUF4878 domain-containing protein [Eubacteriales bacterium]